MASLTLSPNPCKVGQSVTVEGLDFAASAQVTITVMSPHGRGGTFSAQIAADSSGEVASTDLPNYAIATLTLAGNAIADETVTIGAVTYTWKASVAATANQVKVGATASESLDNLKSAINADGNTAVYGSATTAHPTARAGKKTATTLLIIAKSGGTGGNSLASTETMTNGSFGGATFAGGAAASGNYDFQFQPTVDGIWDVSATDGTNTADTTLQVFTSA